MFNDLNDKNMVNNNEGQLGISSSRDNLQASQIREPKQHVRKMMKEKYKKHKIESGCGDNKSELDKYLNEDNEEDTNEDFDILEWWKLHSPRFPILSQMARNVLAFPISTVASESAFSTGGRVLNSFRSSLTPKIAEALICAQDWLRSSSMPVNIEEALEDLETFEKNFPNIREVSSTTDL
ncbi:uncharacterized protein LOC143881158 [Tasmannia lanceolata]|uniref:uncharacterized protein LOC143881158 n=1 Tax=Tasmannia lanceolata TaxID=3420 RepID=UPI00406420BB